MHAKKFSLNDASFFACAILYAIIKKKLVEIACGVLLSLHVVSEHYW